MDYADDIPQTLSRAYYWLSHTPERRFEQARNEYAAVLTADRATFAEAAAAGGTESILEVEFARYREGLRKRWTAAVASDSRCASSFITGGSNFPARRMEKRNNIAAKRWSEVIEFQKRARQAILRTLNPAAYGSDAIFAGDSDAVERLAAKVTELEAKQQHMRAVNDAHKRFQKDPKSLDNADLDDKAKQTIRGYVPAYSWEPHPYAPYQLSNNSAEIRRAKLRLRGVSALQSKPEVAHVGAVARVEDVPAENRVRIFYPGKPSEATRSELKRNGFRWAPSLGAWQAYRHDHTVAFALKMAEVQS